MGAIALRQGGRHLTVQALGLSLLKFVSKMNFVALVCVDNGRQGMIAVHLFTLEQFVAR